MYKTTVRNMLSRAFRGSAGASTKRFSLKQSRKSGAAQQAKRRERIFATEPELISALGEGPDFAFAILSKHRSDFRKLGADPKKCSAFLNHVAKSRMLDGSLWSDKAIESVLRRAKIKDSKKK